MCRMSYVMLEIHPGQSYSKKSIKLLRIGKDDTHDFTQFCNICGIYGSVWFGFMSFGPIYNPTLCSILWWSCGEKVFSLFSFLILFGPNDSFTVIVGNVVCVTRITFVSLGGRVCVLKNVFFGNFSLRFICDNRIRRIKLRKLWM